MALSLVNLGFNFSSVRSMLKRTSFTCLNPSSTGRKVFEITGIRCSSTHDPALVSTGNVSDDDEISNVRRSGNYPPSMWDYDFFQSLSSDFKGEICSKHASELKENVRMLLNKEDMESLHKLELVDTIQRLGVSYHFQDEIKRILEAINNNEKLHCSQDLNSASLKFRLLRQHGFNVSQEIFKEFMDYSGKFKASLSKDMVGVVSLYEASYLSIRNENIMDEAQDFATKHMEDYINEINSVKDENLVKLVRHALEFPQHWREARQEARWFIDFYETSAPAEDYVSSLLYFAKLDYNMVQSIYQDDLKYLSKWWKDTEWGEKLGFARERMMECFYWAVGYNSHPEFSYGRKVLTAITAFITTIDDIYDVYATLDELEVLTKLTKRWDAAELDQLPDYVKVCFTVFYNDINEVANVAERKHGVSILPYFQKVWTDLFEAYLLEAKWYHSGYKPSLKEYLDNAWISITGPIILTHSYFLTATSITDEALQTIRTYPKIVRLASTILRIADDMGTSHHELERGDNPKLVQCYMNDNGGSEEAAREYIRQLLIENWKDLNEERLAAESTFSKPFIDMCTNLGRIALSTYMYGDGHGAPTPKDKERSTYLFVDPIPM
ncbi:(+)-delta-cadinene synthase [Heracleum sosnowskyi]|uniref:(+)-delta-cadinene synthase n=1 Tax=Heracleum sosnowskyi TaxID=360622 RepID=A0AAD8GXF6_9APIA|nr:(+)-delta-cadinene synthase [Heracleum sosnowskyi]